MRRNFLLSIAVVLSAATFSFSQGEMKFKIHDPNRPLPPVITPGTASTQEKPGTAPSDAVVLFDGKDLSKWVDKDGKPAKWKVQNGYMEVVPGTGNISTRDSFGDCQLHVEFAEPSPAHGESQERGNSGVFLMGLYEIQVLDSYRNKTYPDGQAAAVYCQYPPLVNASRPPGEWQTYDIIFRGPRFANQELTRLATLTLLHNGVLAQDHVELTGPTDYMKRPPYHPHASKMPLLLQDHGQPVRYRNIWIRELQEPGE